MSEVLKVEEAIAHFLTLLLVACMLPPNLSRLAKQETTVKHSSGHDWH